MDATKLTAEVWAGLGGDDADLRRLTITGPAHVLPSVFPATAVATATVAAATLGVARLWRPGGGPDALPQVAVDTRHAAIACHSERYVEVVGHDLGELWSSIAGVYAAADGWIRLHTNFRAHRRAALATLGLDDDGDPRPDRSAVGTAVARWKAVDLEDAIYAAGGCAAALRSADEWLASEPAAAVGAQPLVAITPLGDAPHPGPKASSPGNGPLAGLRVLDLTRSIAGPVAGRFLAAYGADVLRIDAPPGDDSRILIADTTVGKRSALLDLHDPAAREQFEQLVADADVVLCAYRPGALDGLGYGPAALAALRPGLVVATLSAYGDRGPWGDRRGFDSLVQMATGIAEVGRCAAGSDTPVPLPVQLLDHASGYLLAAGVASALARRQAGGGSWHVRVALARTATWLLGLPHTGALDVPGLPSELPDDVAVDLHGPLGHSRHVACPGAIVGAAPSWRSGPVPLGSSEIAFENPHIAG
ncbi:MAG TPA: CoA transferase [Acidimicrobiales bacterium]|nr:CoA transferase [Acidimicrobiales bacterium]